MSTNLEFTHINNEMASQLPKMAALDAVLAY